MLQTVLQHEKKKKLHSVVKESRKFKFQLNMEKLTSILNKQKQLNILKKKAKNTSLEDMKKRWRERNHYMESTL